MPFDDGARVSAGSQSRRVAAFELSRQGLTAKEIARKMGVGLKSVYRYLGGPRREVVAPFEVRMGDVLARRDGIGGGFAFVFEWDDEGVTVRRDCRADHLPDDSRFTWWAFFQTYRIRRRNPDGRVAYQLSTGGEEGAGLPVADARMTAETPHAAKAHSDRGSESEAQS